MRLSNLEVLLISHEGQGIDITSQCTRIQLQEGLGRNIQGSIDIKDGIALLEKAIDTANGNIKISFRYLDQLIERTLYIDSVNGLNLTENENFKTYSINLIALNDMVDAMTTISKAFKGLATDIVSNIWVNSFTNKLLIDRPSETGGAFIAPNMSPQACIENILGASYDTNGNPFYMFERLVNNNTTYIECLTKWFEEKAIFQINTIIQDKSTKGSIMEGIGIPQHIVVHADGGNSTSKIRRGAYGKNIYKYNIDDSISTNLPYGTHVNSSSKMNILRKNMFNNSAPLFSSDNHELVCLAQATSEGFMNVDLTAYGCDAIPNIGVMNKVTLTVAASSIGTSIDTRYSGDYLVSSILHVIEDGIYKQNISLSKG